MKNLTWQDMKWKAFRKKRLKKISSGNAWKALHIKPMQQEGMHAGIQNKLKNKKGPFGPKMKK